MSVNISLFAGVGAQLFDNSGNVLTGGKIFTYAAGTTNPEPTYTTSTGTIPHTNPIILDASGRVPSGGEIWLTDAIGYKFTVTTSTDVLIATYDNVTAQSSGILTSLASTTNNSLGDALIGFKQSNTGGFLANAVGKTVNDKLQEFVSVKDFGAVGNGVTNDTTAIKNAIDYGIANGQSVYVPSGTYICSPNVLLFTFSTSVTKTFTLFGDGATSILKMADGAVGASNLRFFDMRPAVDMDLIELRGLVFDNNARNSPLPPTSFAFQQSHTIRYAAVTGVTTKLLRYHNVVVKDPVADGMNNQGLGIVNNWTILNCAEIDRTRTRSSIQQSYLVDNLIVTGFTGRVIEAEPLNAPTYVKNVFINNCNLERLDIDGNSGVDSSLSVWYVSNTRASVSMSGPTDCTAYFSNCDITLGTTNRIIDVNPNTKFVNTTFRLPYDANTGAVVPLQFFRRLTTESGGTFENCSFLINYTGALPVAPTGYLVDNLTAIVIADVAKHKVTITNCHFDSRAAGSVYAYRNGTWVLNNNTYACSALTANVAAIYWAYQTALYASNVAINGGDFRNCVGHGLAISTVASNSAGPLILTGTHLGAAASLITPAFTSGSLASNTEIYSSRIVQASSLPTMGISGDTVMLPINTLPLGSGSQYMATVISTTAPNYRVISQKGIKRDITANRPTVSANDVGLMYMDTTLDADGKVIWYNGTAWVDATGAVV
jgi:hypothetical protein